MYVKKYYFYATTCNRNFEQRQLQGNTNDRQRHMPIIYRSLSLCLTQFAKLFSLPVPALVIRRFSLFSRLTPPACTFKMDAEAFRKHGKEMVDYIADYLENIRDRRTVPSVQPGYLRKLIPGQAPEDPEKWEDVFGDIERVIMPGVS